MNTSTDTVHFNVNLVYYNKCPKRMQRDLTVTKFKCLVASEVKLQGLILVLSQMIDFSSSDLHWS